MNKFVIFTSWDVEKAVCISLVALARRTELLVRRKYIWPVPLVSTSPQYAAMNWLSFIGNGLGLWGLKEVVKLTIPLLPT